MKNTSFVLAMLLPVLIAPPVMGSITEIYNFTGLGLSVPDGNPAGLANTQPVVSNISSIESVLVSIAVTGTFTGDLYAYIMNDLGFAILLNRTGRTAANPFGYDDDGVVITLSAAAPEDIHTYRNSSVPLAGSPLTGSWQPDGRNVDPNTVTELSPRTALLSSFNTGAGSGAWTLFLADVSSGDQHTLTDWGLTLTGVPVPEPGMVTFLLAAGAVPLLRRRRQPQRHEVWKGGQRFQPDLDSPVCFTRTSD